jgi:MFS family permease
LRIIAGIVGAMSFSTAGALAAGLFPGDPRRTALGIAILFGTGGGLGIVLAGATLPTLLEIHGTAAWPWGWIVIGAMSGLALPLGLWAAIQLRTPLARAATPRRLPIRAMLPELFGYASFGMGYIVYLTFLAAWMQAQDFSGLMIAAVWMLMGLCITLSPFVWRGLFARSATGLPLALVLFCIAAGTALPVLVPVLPALIVSAVVFGLSVFMAPGAVTNFARQNLPLADVGSAVAVFTVGFAAAQIVGPWAAGWLGDATGDIGTGLLGASAVLTLGGLVALTQRPLPDLQAAAKDAA